jgi:ADP-heptose:LPS heptosyltransferase
MAGVRPFGMVDLLADSETKRRRLQSLAQICIPNPPSAGAGRRRVPGVAPALLLAGRLALRRGAVRLAHRLTKLAVAADPTSSAPNRLAAHVEQRRGDFPAELAYRSAAAERDDGRKRGQWELAKALLRLERENLEASSEASRTRLMSALETATTSTDAAIRTAAGIALSDALRDAGAYAESVAPAESALASQLSHLAAARALADSLIVTAQFKQAQALCATYLRQPDEAGFGRRQRLAGLLAERSALTVEENRHIRGEDPKILVAVGGGIGDILHATPTIRNIARRSGSRVDVLVAADSLGAEFLVRNPEYVRAVWPGQADVFDHHYETAFFTHSMATTRFAVNAQRTIAAHAWRRFRAGQLNETLFNLEAAKHLLDIPYDARDVEAYFAGDLVPAAPRTSLVGLNAGSKAGRWLSKRWPFFPELAARLHARGVRVASFGAPQEYVEGTEDRTGGTVEQMCRAMLACTHFVSNDSGPMHIASALGIPVLALFAPTDALTHLPLRETTVALAPDKPCSPCEVKDHPFFATGCCRCIGDIPAAAVEERLLERMAMRRGDNLEREASSADWPDAVQGVAG